MESALDVALAPHPLQMQYSFGASEVDQLL